MALSSEIGEPPSRRPSDDAEPKTCAVSLMADPRELHVARQLVLKGAGFRDTNSTGTSDKVVDFSSEASVKKECKAHCPDGVDLDQGVPLFTLKDLNATVQGDDVIQPWFLSFADLVRAYTRELDRIFRRRGGGVGLGAAAHGGRRRRRHARFRAAAAGAAATRWAGAFMIPPASSLAVMRQQQQAPAAVPKAAPSADDALAAMAADAAPRRAAAAGCSTMPAISLGPTRFARVTQASASAGLRGGALDLGLEPRPPRRAPPSKPLQARVRPLLLVRRLADVDAPRGGVAPLGERRVVVGRRHRGPAGPGMRVPRASATAASRPARRRATAAARSRRGRRSSAAVSRAGRESDGPATGSGDGGARPDGGRRPPTKDGAVRGGARRRSASRGGRRRSPPAGRRTWPPCGSAAPSGPAPCRRGTGPRPRRPSGGPPPARGARARRPGGALAGRSNSWQGLRASARPAARPAGRSATPAAAATPPRASAALRPRGPAVRAPPRRARSARCRPRAASPGRARAASGRCRRPAARRRPFCQVVRPPRNKASSRRARARRFGGETSGVGGSATGFGGGVAGTRGLRRRRRRGLRRACSPGSVTVAPLRPVLARPELGSAPSAARPTVDSQAHGGDLLRRRVMGGSRGARRRPPCWSWPKLPGCWP